MKIRTNQTLTDRKYTVVVGVEDFSELEEELMVNYGEPELNIGGTVGAVTYTDDLKRLKSDSPFRFIADGRDYPLDSDAQTAAEDWQVEMASRIKALMDALRALVDTFTGEELETY